MANHLSLAIVSMAYLVRPDRQLAFSLQAVTVKPEVDDVHTYPYHDANPVSGLERFAIPTRSLILVRQDGMLVLIPHAIPDHQYDRKRRRKGKCSSIPLYVDRATG